MTENLSAVKLLSFFSIDEAVYIVTLDFAVSGM
jgi:hypothetical protein